MIVNASHRSRRRWSVVSAVSVALALGLAVAACRNEPAAPDSGTAIPAPVPVSAVSSRVAAMNVDELREAALKAYGEYRVYAPAEDNAVEYYLGLRDKLPGDAAVSSALIDLLPMTVVGAEQSIEREDFAEAQRLVALLEKGDARHPALARLKDSIAAKQVEVAKRAAQQVLTAEAEARKLAELKRQRLEDQQQQRAQVARQLAARQAAERQQAERHEAVQRAVEQRAAPPRATGPAATATRSVPDTAQPVASAAVLRPISQPAPRYPSSAELAGQSGEVLVEFTVGTDGSVTAARVVRSNPPRIFDHEAVKAVRKWRFQPVAAPVTTRRTIRFSPLQ